MYENVKIALIAALVVIAFAQVVPRIPVVGPTLSGLAN